MHRVLGRVLLHRKALPLTWNIVRSIVRRYDVAQIRSVCIAIMNGW